MYREVIQLYVYILFRFFSHIGYYKTEKDSQI